MMEENQETKTCPYCGQTINAMAQKCRFCGEWLQPQNSLNNTQNIKKALPEEYKKFNWGAFLLSWIWGIGNKTYIALLMLAGYLISIIPFVGWIAPLAFQVWLGIKGNELAWQNKDWSSLEEFNETQRKWAMWSVIALGIGTLLGIIITVIVVIIASSSGY